MEKGLKEEFMTNLEKKAKSAVTSLALVTALNLTPISTEQKNNPNIGLPNASTISLSLENKAYAEEMNENNITSLYNSLNKEIPRWFFPTQSNLITSLSIKKIGNNYIATDSFSVVAKYSKNNWEKLPINSLLYQDNPKLRMGENLERFKNISYSYKDDMGKNKEVKNPLNLLDSDIKEYKNNGTFELSNMTLITNADKIPMIILSHNNFTDSNLKKIKEAFEILNRDKEKLNEITTQYGLRAITGHLGQNVQNKNALRISVSTLVLNPNSIENPLDIYLSILYQSKLLDIWKNSKGDAKNLNLPKKEDHIIKINSTIDYVTKNKKIFSDNEFAYMLNELKEIRNYLTKNL